jgi:hypothetical protein
VAEAERAAEASMNHAFRLPCNLLLATPHAMASR